MIAVVIFSGVIMVLVGLSFQVAKRTTESTDQALIMSVMQERLDAFTVAAYDSLAGMAGCDTTQIGNARVYACVTVTTATPRTSTVAIAVHTSVPGTDTTSITFERGRLRRPIPLQ